jgi:hypothetical protein
VYLSWKRTTSRTGAKHTRKTGTLKSSNLACESGRARVLLPRSVWTDHWRLSMLIRAYAASTTKEPPADCGRSRSAVRGEGAEHGKPAPQCAKILHGFTLRTSAGIPSSSNLHFAVEMGIRSSSKMDVRAPGWPAQLSQPRYVSPRVVYAPPLSLWFYL